MAKEFNYYIDIHTNETVVRESRYGILEGISEAYPVWIRVPRDDPYEREINLGQGDNCLFDFTYEEAKACLAFWGIDIDAEQTGHMETCPQVGCPQR